MEENKCIFCGIIEGKVATAKVYEDDEVICVLDIFPASKGHIMVIPKKHVSVTAQLDDKLLSHVFLVANKMSQMVFEAFGANGTNILVSNGAAAGQKVDHVAVNVIPRYEGDDVNISWKNEQITQDELKDVFTKLSEKFGGGNVEEKPQVVEEKKPLALEDVVLSKEPEKKVEEEKDLTEETFEEEESLP